MFTIHWTFLKGLEHHLCLQPGQVNDPTPAEAELLRPSWITGWFFRSNLKNQILGMNSL
jgi:hypothetical protein